jgi:hypothetical protein
MDVADLLASLKTGIVEIEFKSLNLENTKEELKERINKKLVFGISKKL